MRQRNNPAEAKDISTMEAFIAAKKRELKELCCHKGLEYGDWGLQDKGATAVKDAEDGVSMTTRTTSDKELMDR